MFHNAGWKANVESLEEFDCQYSAVTVLRVLLRLEQEEQEEQKVGTPPLFGRFMDHNVERQEEQPSIWKFEKEFMVNFIHQKLKLQERFLEDQIHRAAGMIMTNATSVRLPEEGYGRASALFPVYSMMNHSCMPNTKTLMNPDYSQEIIVQVAIQKGEEVTNQYMKALKPTSLRRPFLREKWCFDCLCRRCRDPSELGSHLGSLLCQVARCGGTVVAVTPLHYSSEWHCQSCQGVVSKQEVSRLLESASQLVEETVGGEKVVEHHERVVHALATVLHPHNWLMLGLKQELGLLYGSTLPWQEMSRPAKERKMQCCQEVVEVLGQIEVGWSTARARVLGELTRARVLVAKENAMAGRLGRQGLQKVLLQARMLMVHMAYQNNRMTGLKSNGIELNGPLKK